MKRSQIWIISDTPRNRLNREHRIGERVEPLRLDEIMDIRNLTSEEAEDFFELYDETDLNGPSVEMTIERMFNLFNVDIKALVEPELRLHAHAVLKQYVKEKVDEWEFPELGTYEEYVKLTRAEPGFVKAQEEGKLAHMEGVRFENLEKDKVYNVYHEGNNTYYKASFIIQTEDESCLFEIEEAGDFKGLYIAISENDLENMAYVMEVEK